MDFIGEFNNHRYKFYSTNTILQQKAFADNYVMLEMELQPKLRLRSKHINCDYHHLQEHTRSGLNLWK